jgi:hypothetical protein
VPFLQFRTPPMHALLGTKPGKTGQLCQTKKPEQAARSNNNQEFIC